MKELSKEKYRIVWIYHGFREDDLPKWKLKSIQESFLRLRNAYAEWCQSTELFEKLTKEYKNTHCKAYPYEKWESLEGYMYGSWMAYQINKRFWDRDSAYGENLRKIGLDDPELQPIIFMDGSLPDFGCAFRHYPGWAINMALEEVND